MQAIFIAYDLAHHEEVVEVLNACSCRGYTSFGTHAWPSLASAMLTMVEDDRVDKVLERLKAIDDNKPRLGLRAFVWPVTRSI